MTAEIIRTASAEILHDCAPERIIHHRIKLIAQQIAPLDAVGFLGRGILPDLTDDDMLPVRSLHTVMQMIEKGIRQLVGNVQTEARRTETHPVFEHTAFAADIIRILRLILIDIRKRVDAPP